MGEYENRLSREIIDYLITTSQATVWRQNNHRTPGRKHIGLKGIGDISGITPKGIRVEIETKTPIGTQSEFQISFEKLIISNGGIYICCNNMDDFIKQWQEQINGKN